MPAEDRPAPERPARSGLPFPRRARPRRPGEPVRAGILTPSLSMGGAEVWMAELVRHTDPARVRWAGIAGTNPPAVQRAMVDRLEAAGAAVRWDPAAAADLAAASDVLVVWGFDVFAEMPEIAAAAPVVLVSHGIGEWTARAMRSAGRAAALVAVSAAAVAPFPEDQRARARVIPNGIEPARVAPAPGGRERVRAEWGVPDGRHACLYLGRLASEKNPRAFLEAADACEWRWPGRFAFVVAGDGYLGDRERAWAAAHAPGVVWAGRREDVADCLAAADTLVLPSHEEACSMTLIEALTAGVPALATPVGLLGEPEHAGLARLLPRGPDGAAIAEALAADLADPAGRADRAARAREVMAGFTARRMAEDYVDLIESVAPAPDADPTPRRAAVTSPAESAARRPYVDLRPLVWACDYRGEVLGDPCGCSAEVRHCGLGKGFFPAEPFEVRMSDCLRCVKGRP